MSHLQCYEQSQSCCGNFAFAGTDTTDTFKGFLKRFILNPVNVFCRDCKAMTEHNTVHYYKLSLGCYLQSVVVEVLCNLIDMFSYFQVVTSDQ